MHVCCALAGVGPAGMAARALAPAAVGGEGDGTASPPSASSSIRADFKHFEWVNPDAPKGGRLATIGTAARTSFDSFNNFILKGDAAQGLDYLFDYLMVRALDEPDAVYGLVASTARAGAGRQRRHLPLAPGGQVRRRLAADRRRMSSSPSTP